MTRLPYFHTISPNNLTNGDPNSQVAAIKLSMLISCCEIPQYIRALCINEYMMFWQKKGTTKNISWDITMLSLFGV